ncbi:Casein kinase I isoform gamma-3 [Penicillium subrubescens]|uniref:Casein kinase I isoform gamma-3 n=1 Tax=Penicillium subrubescens TaxID=1316194 RepID=A0A1Q5UC23_9EURO|nr:Casein kinase I isoform gamma-3 [Penicillium subrubescens]
MFYVNVADILKQRRPDTKKASGYYPRKSPADTDPLVENQEGKVTVKTERGSGLFSPQSSTLHHEYELYRQLSPSQGVPSVYWHGHHRFKRGHACGWRYYLVLERLGPTLHHAVQVRLGRPRLASSGLFFSLEEIADIGKQMVSTLKFIHRKNFIHGDVQPRKIAYDLSFKRMLLIGFGATQGLEPLPRQPAGPESSIVFSSRFRQQGDALSRRDDMESLGYVLVFLFRGQLPWQAHGMAADSILSMKSSIATENLCSGLQPLCEYMNSVKALASDQIPDYDNLSRMLGLLAS